MKAIGYYFCFTLLLALKSLAIDAGDCVDKAMAVMGIEGNPQSDPSLINDILKNDMYLSELLSIRNVLGAKLTSPQAMGPMIEQIRSGIIERHPAIVEFLCEAHRQNILFKMDATRILNHMFILQDIVSAMAKDYELMEEVHKSFLQRRAQYGIRECRLGSMIDIYEAGGGLFGAVKAVTIDSAMDMYTNMRRRSEITPEELKARTKGLTLNILEAYAADRLQGNKENALAGLALASISPETIAVEGEDRRVKYVYDQEWTSLYETWNIAFIIANLGEDFNLIIQKLFVPVVLDADPEDYLFNRVLALWTSINFVLFAKLDQKPESELVGADEIARLWGSINYRYAKSYVEKHANDSWSAYLVLKRMQLHETVKAGKEMLWGAFLSD